MPQDNQTPQVPGSDVLLDTLRRSRITDDQRQQMWDAYTKPKDEKSFVDSMRGLDVNDEVRQNLYDMRFKGWKNEGNKPQSSAQTVANLDTQKPAQGEVRSSTAEVLQKTTGIRPSTMMERLGNVVAPFMEHMKVGGAASEEGLLQPGAAVSSQHPIGKAVGEFAGGLTTAPNLIMLGGGGMLAKGAPVLSKLLNLGFSQQMLRGAYERYAPFKQALDNNDADGALYHFTHMVLGGAFGLHSATEGMSTDPKTREAVRNQIKAESKRTGGDPVLNNAVRQAATLPDKSTPLGPISETGGQQLQLDFTEKAPTEAKAPHRTDLDAVKSGAPPVVDRQALIAPKPEDYVGKESPIGLYRFPKATVEGLAKGETPGLGRVDLSQVPKLTFETDRLGVKWAIDDKGVRVSIPNRIAPEEVASYAAQKIAEQGKAQAEIKAKVPEKPVDIVTQLHNRFSQIADLNRQVDLAENDAHADDLTRKKALLEQEALDTLRQQPLGPQHAKAFTETADRLDAQSKAIKDLTEATIKNRGIKNEIADLRSQGGPPREAVIDPETGERAVVKPQDRVGRGGRSVLDELQGRVPTSDFENIKVAGKPEGVSDQEWAEHVTKLQEERQGLKRKISDSVTIASETGASVADMGIEEHVDRLKQIESMLGKYTEPAETGRRPNIPAEVDDKGAIKAPEALKSWTLERARLALGSKLKQMPTDEEFFQHADMLQEKGRLFRRAADVASEVAARRKQAGFIGEGPLRGRVAGKVEPVSLRDMVPDDKELMKRAQAAKIYAREIDEKFPMGVVGFLSKDGKIGIDTGLMTHDDVSQTLLPEIVKANVGSSLRAMLEKGWIRKASPIDYETWHDDSKSYHTIEMDLLNSGRHGQEINIDTRKPDGRLAALYLEQGWGDKYHDLAAAVDAAKHRQGWGTETGAVKGRTLLASSTVGGLVGAVVGAHIGDPYAGTAIGWGLGFITPAIVDHPVFWNTVNSIKPGITSLGIKMSDWLGGVKQADPVNADMKTILDAQRRDIKGPTKSMLTRVAQLPGDLQNKIFDKFVFFNDRPGAMVNLLMKFDPRGAEFRDLRGKLDVDNSPYVSAWLAAGGGNGMAEAHLIDYKKMYSEAQGKGLVNNLNEYLNLKGYQRVYDVMQERIQEHDQNILKMQQALQQPKLPVEVEAGIKKALRESKADRQDIIDKLTSKTLVPQPYDPPKIANDLGALQAALGPKFNDVQALANRVFALNRKVLDMTHDAGIIGDADYQKYTGRGDEYIPMHRILEQIADNTGRTSGKGSPLYLRQQNVIKALMGSERVNRDPIIASADANLEAMREVARNNVMKDMLKVASADPQGVGSLFKQVKSGYKAAPDEGLVGFYDGGIQHTFAVPSYLAESLKNVSPASMDVIGKGPLQYFGQILRKGATMGNLAWSVPNALRHLGDMAIMSDAGLKDIRTLPRDVSGLIREWNKSLYSTIVNDSARQEYLRSGAAYSTLQSVISPEEKLDPTTLGFKQKIAHGRLIDVVADFNKAVEDATKMTTFKRLRQAGYSEKGAAWETRRYGGGPDFARQGNLTPAIGMVSMFFNAHLQYVTRAFARAAEQPARVAVALGAITAMAMTLNEHNYNQKDEKGNLLMRKVPYTDRENNFVVLSGDTYQSSSGATLPVYYKVPKPSFVKFLYNPIENMLNKVAGHEERSGTQLGLQAIGNLSPGQMDLQQGEVGKSAVRGVVSSLNPVIRAPLEEAMNYKTTGVGAPIIPSREMNIDPRFQYSPNTSQMAQRMGEGGWRGAVAGGAEGTTIGYLLGGPKGAAIGGGLGTLTGSFGVSPRRAEHVIDTTTAGVGRIATGFVDPFLGGVKQTRLEGPEKLASTPIAGPILGRFVSTSIDQQEQALTQEFYRNAQAAQEPMNTIQFLKKNHPEQIPAYIEAHKDDLWKAQIATTMQSRLGQITNAQREVEQNQSMSDNDRADALKNLHAVKLQVLKVFTGVMRPSPQVGQAASAPGQGQGAPR